MQAGGKEGLIKNRRMKRGECSEDENKNKRKESQVLRDHLHDDMARWSDAIKVKYRTSLLVGSKVGGYAPLSEEVRTFEASICAPYANEVNRNATMNCPPVCILRYRIFKSTSKPPTTVRRARRLYKLRKFCCNLIGRNSSPSSCR